MPYATVDDLKLRFQDTADLLDRNADGDPDAGLAEAVISDASQEIDQILSRRYSVPVTGAPWLVSACCDLVRFRLYTDAVPEVVKDRRDETLRQLRAVALGTASLVDTNGSPIAERSDAVAGGGAVSRSPRARVFSDSNLAGYMGE